MIKHIVCFKLEDNSPEACQKAAEVLMSMKRKLPDAEPVLGVKKILKKFVV